jgi:hypothetical protein
MATIRQDGRCSKLPNATLQPYHHPNPVGKRQLVYVCVSVARLGSLEWWDCRYVHGKDLEGKNHRLSEIQFHISLDVMRKTTRNLNQDSRCPGRDSNLRPFE